MPVPKEWVVLPNNVEGQKVLQKGMRYRISMPPEANLFALEVNALKNIGFKVLEAFDDHTSAPFDWPGQEIGAAWRFTVEWPEANPIKIYPSPNVIYYQEIDRLTGVRYRLPYRLPY